MSIPDFNENGELPPGIHQTTLEEISSRFDLNSHRHDLFNKLMTVIYRLEKMGVRHIYVDGSFVTNKPFPSDIDGCWEDNDNIDWSIDKEMEEMLTEQHRLKQRYKIELYDSDNITERKDKHGGFARMTFLKFFQLNKEDVAKGILCIDIQRI